MHTHHDLDDVAVLESGDVLVRRHGGEVGDDVVERERGGEGDSLGDRGFLGGVYRRGLLYDQGVSPLRNTIRQPFKFELVPVISEQPSKQLNTHSLQRSRTLLPSTTVGINFLRTSPRIELAV